MRQSSWQDDRRDDDEPDAAARPPTLGERLSVAGQQLRSRHLPVYAWAAAFAPVLERLEDLSWSWADRFERTESGRLQPVAGPRPGRTPLSPTAPQQPGPAQPAQPPDASVAPAMSGAEEAVLPVDVRARLRDVAGPGADALHVRADAGADALARAHRADAVTIGTDVHVRSGRLRPDTRDGFALLAHEASHVTALLAPGGPARRSAPGGRAGEEAAAGRIERLAHQQPWPGPAGGDQGSGPDALIGRALEPGAASAPSAAPAPSLAGPPASPLTAPATAAMRADLDRAEAGAPAPFDVEALRRSLIDDLMRRVRTDFERGG